MKMYVRVLSPVYLHIIDIKDNILAGISRDNGTTLMNVTTCLDSELLTDLASAFTTVSEIYAKMEMDRPDFTEDQKMFHLLNAFFPYSQSEDHLSIYSKMTKLEARIKADTRSRG